ncbi:hypothetical protein C8J31_10831 [Rhizobium sp. PP-CC-2G-626]|nr:hypothetical protein C8J31_10831 [Rhizobium sp. PP-CC-2G-626]
MFEMAAASPSATGSGGNRTFLPGRQEARNRTESASHASHNCSMVAAMSKALSLLLLALMTVQLVKPLGWPGLRYRRDFWKIAVAAIAVMMLTVLIRP